MKTKKIGQPQVQGGFWALVRISIGLIFLWPFLDKLFGLGISTLSSGAWINGGSPTAGFLQGNHGIFSPIFQSMASSHIVEWLFMLGLLFVGLTMILGIGMRLGAITGSVMMFLFWLALFPPQNNPILDEHWFYAFALIASAIADAGKHFGLGNWWSRLKLVKKYPVLE